MTVLPIAAPSCILPDHVAANAYFLASKVQEVGLCFFETKACLDYSEKDLPQDLATLPLTWHIHLPVDLPWGTSSDIQAAQAAFNIAQKVNHLNPRCVVLHPPTKVSLKEQEALLSNFADYWYKHSTTPILLENIEGAPLANLSSNLFSSSHIPFGICLDVGHMLGYGHVDILMNSHLLDKVGLVHWSAPGKKDEHLALKHFTPSEYLLAKQVVKRIPCSAHHMLEIFNWENIVQSYPILRQLLDNTDE